jgi:O-antigen ligase
LGSAFFSGLTLFIYTLLKNPKLKLSLSKVFLVLAFPLYLIFHSLLFGNFNFSLMGNTDRYLGIITYGTCAIFFVLGCYLRKSDNRDVIYTVTLIHISQFVYLVLKYSTNRVDFLKGPLFNANSSGVLFGISTCVITIKIFEQKSIWKYSSIVFLLPTVLYFYLINSIQCLIALAVVLLSYLGVKVGLKGTYNTIFWVTLVFLLSIPFIIFIMLTPTPTRKSADSNSFLERLEIYKTGLRGFTSNPLFGVGVDHFNLLYFKFNYTNNLKLVDNAHSVPIQLLCTVGLLGLIIYYFTIYKLLTFRERLEHSNDKAVFLGIFFYFITSLVAIQNPSTEFILFLLMGSLIGSIMIDSSKKNRKFFTDLPLQFISIFIIVFSIVVYYQYIKVSSIAKPANKALVNVVSYRESINSFSDLGVLFNMGQFAVNTKNKELALTVLHRMTEVSREDQRTIALALILADFLEDKNLEKFANQLEVEARS